MTLEIEPLIVRPAQACVMLSCSIPRLYELINAGELESLKDGAARKITVASIQRYIARKLAEQPARKPAQHDRALAEGAQ
jgi:excisionase family DNA binding protein